MQAVTQEQYIEFSVENENYAIHISHIHEIIKMQTITEVPNCRHYVRGVINLRGKVVPVISLRALFSLPSIEATNQTRIIVVNHQEESVGIIVDRVNKVTRFSDIQPPPERIGELNGAFFVGIGFTDTGLVGVLELDEILLRQ